jgi:hypothetical protein
MVEVIGYSEALRLWDLVAYHSHKFGHTMRSCLGIKALVPINERGLEDKLQ